MKHPSEMPKPKLELMCDPTHYQLDQRWALKLWLDNDIKLIISVLNANNKL